VDFLVDVEVIRGHAGLASIHKFAPNGPSGGKFDVGILVDDAGRFASELQTAGREIRSGFGEDFTARGSPAGEEDVIVFLVQEIGVLLMGAQNHFDEARITEFFKHLGHHLTDVLGGGGGFDEGGIPGGEAAH
jgi:hypothetical protein